MIRQTFWLACILLAIQCQNASDTNCRYGEPQPVFSAENSQLTDHVFRQDGQDATETFRLSDGTEVEIYQSGCDEIVQEYRFIGPEQIAEPSLAERAVRRFNQLAAISPDPLQFSQYANAILENEDVLQTEKMVQLGVGFFLQLEEITPGGQSGLRVLMQSTAPK